MLQKTIALFISLLLLTPTPSLCPGARIAFFDELVGDLNTFFARHLTSGDGIVEYNCQVGSDEKEILENIIHLWPRSPEILQACLVEKSSLPSKEPWTDINWKTEKDPFTKYAFLIGFTYGNTAEVDRAITLYNLLLPYKCCIKNNLLSYVDGYLSGAFYKNEVSKHKKLSTPSISERSFTRADVQAEYAKGYQTTDTKIITQRRANILTETPPITLDIANIAFTAGHETRITRDLIPTLSATKSPHTTKDERQDRIQQLLQRLTWNTPGTSAPHAKTKQQRRLQEILRERKTARAKASAQEPAHQKPLSQKELKAIKNFLRNAEEEAAQREKQIREEAARKTLEKQKKHALLSPTASKPDTPPATDESLPEKETSHAPESTIDEDKTDFEKVLTQEERNAQKAAQRKAAKRAKKLRERSEKEKPIPAPIKWSRVLPPQLNTKHSTPASADFLAETICSYEEQTTETPPTFSCEDWYLKGKQSAHGICLEPSITEQHKDAIATENRDSLERLSYIFSISPTWRGIADAISYNTGFLDFYNTYRSINPIKTTLSDDCDKPCAGAGEATLAPTFPPYRKTPPPPTSTTTDASTEADLEKFFEKVMQNLNADISLSTLHADPTQPYQEIVLKSIAQIIPNIPIDDDEDEERDEDEFTNNAFIRGFSYNFSFGNPERTQAALTLYKLLLNEQFEKQEALLSFAAGALESAAYTTIIPKDRFPIHQGSEPSQETFFKGMDRYADDCEDPTSASPLKHGIPTPRSTGFNLSHIAFFAGYRTATHKTMLLFSECGDKSMITTALSQETRIEDIKELLSQTAATLPPKSTTTRERLQQKLAQRKTTQTPSAPSTTQEELKKRAKTAKALLEEEEREKEKLTPKLAKKPQTKGRITTKTLPKIEECEARCDEETTEQIALQRKEKLVKAPISLLHQTREYLEDPTDDWQPATRQPKKRTTTKPTRTSTTPTAPKKAPPKSYAMAAAGTTQQTPRRVAPTPPATTPERFLSPTAEPFSPPPPATMPLPRFLATTVLTEHGPIRASDLIRQVQEQTEQAALNVVYQAHYDAIFRAALTEIPELTIPPHRLQSYHKGQSYYYESQADPISAQQQVENIKHLLFLAQEKLQTDPFNETEKFNAHIHAGFLDGYYAAQSTATYATSAPAATPPHDATSATERTTSSPPSS